jgi:hypothetical protein
MKEKEKTSKKIRNIFYFINIKFTTKMADKKNLISNQNNLSSLSTSNFKSK